ncbi:peptidoglycan DD-metalloendopeptidase family protein [Mycobacterium sp.]|uniref:peptidoglycan DD-metalloendopeptidase family protein n=1 Tax=Mycobacterium sp. TaxID=1785 RepID=UPI00261C23F7|nr:peptidoglycan DD-metalloendopeptidase family protein [Mycobacterium sp.]
MAGKGHGLGVFIAVAAALVVSVPLLVVGSLGAPPTSTSCVPGPTSNGQVAAIPGSSRADGLDAAQVGHAATIIAVGRAADVPDRGIVVALATALQESRLRVYANDGTGALAADQIGIAASLRLPHDAVGRDHGSLGLFQQQWPWWGPMRTLMDPASSARLFYTALRRVPSWQQLPLAVAAQSVQNSAYPSAYADDEPLARHLLTQLNSGVNSGVNSVVISGADMGADTGADCGAPTGGGVVRFPLPTGSGYVDQHNFAATGSSWAHRHTGTDLSVACGTPVHAVHAGTVQIVTDQAWAGPWLVKIAVAPGRLTTWYAHMQAVTVSDGDHVEAGATIGRVGEQGNAHGCHLHLEVHPHGGSIYQDPIDPSRWLADHVGRTLDGAISGIVGGSSLGRIASFNVLGDSHTRPDGEHPQMASGRQRIRWALRLLEHHRINLVGLQELQTVQAQGFRQMVGSRWGLWHAPHDTQDAVAWRTDTWQAVERRLTPIPYFGGRIRAMPVVLLRHRATGRQVWVISVHNPADTHFSGHNQSHRREAIRREIALAHALLSTTGAPVILIGDLNEKTSTFCRLTANGDLHAAAGGSHAAGTCRPPRYGGIDWIFGSPIVGWADWTVDRSAAVRRTTDHPLVFATLTSLG